MVRLTFKCQSKNNNFSPKNVIFTKEFCNTISQLKNKSLSKKYLNERLFFVTLEFLVVMHQNEENKFIIYSL